MDEIPSEPSPGLQPGERVERIEIVERAPIGGVAPTRAGTPMWAWLLPLVLVVVVLAWYVLTRGEPTSPVEIITDAAFLDAAIRTAIAA